MKPIKQIFLVLCAALMLFPLAAAQAESPQINTARFSLYDMVVAYVYVGATKEEARAVFGAPVEGTSETSQATGETIEVWQYGGLVLTFSGDGTLVGAEVSDEAYLGPRGVTVNMTLMDVVGKFYMDPDKPSTTVLYAAAYVDVFDAQLPPCGYVERYDDGSYSIIYVAPETPFSAELLADPTNYIYEMLATFTVSFSPDGIVQKYSWRLGPWAE
jgi:hypothetical protein